MLLHDFGGHDTRAILQALGLELGDLFPRAASLRTPVRHRRPDRPRLSARDALDMLSHESWVLVLFGRRAVVFEATPADWQRAREALDRIERLRSYVR
ncbi:MAG: hypothetical protein V2J02_08605 [Pseudomonadales bacterium]|nr:hypothetical protein [Pseudomonadales bacterium]